MGAPSAGGLFWTADGIPASGIAAWNGTSWSPLGSGVDGYVNALAVSGTTLYAGGSFTTAGGVPAPDIAAWNGTNWSALDSGTNAPVDALAASGTTLYASGAFSTAGGVPANFIAAWNGTSWSALGSGLQQHGGYAMALRGRTVYAGGIFTIAGGKPSTSIAAWSPPCTAAQFSDVHPAHYFYTPVSHLAGRGVISGYGDCIFRPYNTTTRGQMVKIVVGGLGVAAYHPPAGAYTFADVPPAQPF